MLRRRSRDLLQWTVGWRQQRLRRLLVLKQDRSEMYQLASAKTETLRGGIEKGQR